ncbi:MAG: S46 family peptidase [Gemmatimonadota bacterium]|nr:S46 family peptidase [Gemmatimonadota bacterium]
MSGTVSLRQRLLRPLVAFGLGLIGLMQVQPVRGQTVQLEPSQQAQRAAERAQLSGIETGTMWTFENAPLDYWEEAYGFRPTAEWLEHVQLSSVRYGESCSASFVSPNGLVMTNHHCARACVEAVSTAASDYVEDGFYAATREDELVCPDLFLDQLVAISSVTDRVRAAAEAGGSDQETAAAQEAERTTIEESCETDSENECQVVALFNGGQYQLYEYRRFSPVKLVFAPELQAGFFGGDPDNFTYPRYALDVAFVRAYEEDGTTPSSTPHHFEWDAEGADEGEVVFVTGNPGSTDRGATVGQLLYEQAYRHPFLIRVLEGQRDVFRTIAGFGPEAERSVREQIFGIENSLKALSGQLEGLRDTLLMGQKMSWEAEFRTRIANDPDLAAEFGDTWDGLTDIQYDKMRVSPALNANDPLFGGGDPTVMMATMLVRYLRDMAMPEAERAEEFQGEALAASEAQLRGPPGLPVQLAEMLLELRLDVARRWLAEDDPFLALAFQGDETPAEAASRLLASTEVLDPNRRGALMAEGAATLATTDDPFLRLAIHMVDAHAELLPRWEGIQAAEVVQEERLARAQFAAFGTDLPPDATFTLRITDGVVKRYPYNGTFAPSNTTMGGMYERAAAFGNEMPWTLPAAWEANRADVNLDAPLDFVTTNDITGGNSGSPMIDQDARVVGIAFDGNIEQLPNEFLFRTGSGRTVGVHSAGITEALRSVYKAEALLQELIGTP